MWMRGLGCRDGYRSRMCEVSFYYYSGGRWEVGVIVSRFGSYIWGRYFDVRLVVWELRCIIFLCFGLGVVLCKGVRGGNGLVFILY